MVRETWRVTGKIVFPDVVVIEAKKEREKKDKDMKSTLLGLGISMKLSTTAAENIKSGLCSHELFSSDEQNTNTAIWLSKVLFYEVQYFSGISMESWGCGAKCSSYGQI